MKDLTKLLDLVESAGVVRREAKEELHWFQCTGEFDAFEVDRFTTNFTNIMDRIDDIRGKIQDLLDEINDQMTAENVFYVSLLGAAVYDMTLIGSEIGNAYQDMLIEIDEDPLNEDICVCDDC